MARSPSQHRSRPPRALPARRGVSVPNGGTASPKLRVLLVDEHRLFAETIAPVLEEHGVDVLGIATSGEDAAAAASIGLPDIVVACLWVGRLLEASHEARALAVFAANDPRGVLEAIRASLEHYLAGRDSKAGTSIGSAATANDGGQPKPVFSEPLTGREQQVLALLVQGSGNKEIGRLLSLRPDTVRTHVQNLFRKLRVHSRLEAATTAMRGGLVTASNGSGNTEHR
jgi:two-component system, NarL family, nitrate/nitrite response regulator NarL